jgi:hypothetical protein
MASIAKHRKVAASFRDVQLFEIFQLTVNMLQNANDNIKIVDATQVFNYNYSTFVIVSLSA